jgi:hypothetical protein
MKKTGPTGPPERTRRGKLVETPSLANPHIPRLFAILLILTLIPIPHPVDEGKDNSYTYGPAIGMRAAVK